ncbi:MAG: transaldolase [Anaerolineales bacterium]|nr:transaldolase [Chloroflexota bacterium]MBL6983097.1 transaldolase [Anaerolineales bacterium]
MKFFLDSAIVDEIAYALDTFDIDGITTNPRHVQVSGKPFMSVIKEIANLVEGTEKTISVEVNPHIMDTAEMIAEAEKLAAISANFVIKLQCVEVAFKAIKTLSEQGIRVNCTLIFSAMQALQAMRSGAYYISPFIGWKESNAEDVQQFIEDVSIIRDNFNFDTEIIVAAVRNARQIADAAVAGADIVTAGLQVYQDGFDHPYTQKGIKIFSDFWDKTQYE